MGKISNKHFEILGVHKDSTKEEIKKAYRNLMKLWHSDKHQNDPKKIIENDEKCKIINEAYSLLKIMNHPINHNH